MSVPRIAVPPRIDLRTKLLLLASAAVTLAIFLVDVAIPLGVADSVPYVLPILVSIWLPWRQAPLLFAGGATLLTVIGYVLSPAAAAGTPAWMAIANRALAMFAIWTTAVLCYWRQCYAEKLEHEQANLRAVIDTSADAVVTIDEQGLIQSFSRAGERLFGYSEAEVLGRNVGILMPEPFRSQHDSHIRRYVETGMRRVLGVGRMVQAQRKDGSVFPVHLMLGEAFTDRGRLFTGFLHDMTAQERARVKAQELQQELYRMGRLSELGEMASAIAHELNQPLTAISNFVSAAHKIIERIDSEVAARAGDLMCKAVQQADRAGQIIRRLRQLIGRGQTELLPVQVNDVVRDACALALIGTHQGTVELDLVLSDPLPAVLADATQIQQVVFNLVRNSIEAVKGSERRAVLVSTAANAHGSVEVAVADTGPGLPAEVEERLFMPFVTTKPNGMGIGLSICRSIIDAHDGHIWARPNPHGGTIFAFSLPVHEVMEEKYE